MNGILLIDKPPQWTSMDVCAKLRGALREKRVGHSGTLDPMATGLLVVFLGRATRAVEFAEADQKCYAAELQLGLTTDTQDSTGTVLERRPTDGITDAALDAVLEQFRGEITQLPPMYSAVKVDGQPLYKLARKGKEVPRAARSVTIYELTRGAGAAGCYPLFVRCSKGTYIRTLCHEIGQALGCGGVMSGLRRTEAGPFRLSEAHSLQEVLDAAGAGRAEALLLPVDSLFPACKPLTLAPIQEKLVRNGSAFSCRLPEGRYRLYGADRTFLAIAEAGQGKMKPIKSFFEVTQ